MACFCSTAGIHVHVFSCAVPDSAASGGCVLALTMLPVAPLCVPFINRLQAQGSSGYLRILPANSLLKRAYFAVMCSWQCCVPSCVVC